MRSAGCRSGSTSAQPTWSPRARPLLKLCWLASSLATLLPLGAPLCPAPDGPAPWPVPTSANRQRSALPSAAGGAAVARLRGGEDGGGGSSCLGRGILARTWDVAVYRLYLLLGITRYRDEYSGYEAGRNTNSKHRELVTQRYIMRKGDGKVRLKPPESSRKHRWERIERNIIKDEVRQLKEMRLGGSLGRGKECEEQVYAFWEQRARSRGFTGTVEAFQEQWTTKRISKRIAAFRAEHRLLREETCWGLFYCLPLYDWLFDDFAPDPAAPWTLSGLPGLPAPGAATGEGAGAAAAEERGERQARDTETHKNPAHKTPAHTQDTAAPTEDTAIASVDPHSRTYTATPGTPSRGPALREPGAASGLSAVRQALEDHSSACSESECYVCVCECVNV